jgi:poly(A) polymerase
MSSSAGRSPLPLQQAAVEVARGLLDAGHETYFAGGCVRDRLLGSEPDDFDIATSATPEEVRRVYPRAHGVGESFGVMLVRAGGHVFEVATFRSDGDYADGRRPTDVRFTTAAEDAERRDFTINGLFQEPLTGRIVDFVGGQEDIARGVIRAIGDPHARFGEDHLRLLRGVRFAARYGFALDLATSTAMREHAEKLDLIARERIGGELRRMLIAPSRAAAVRLLETHGLDRPILHEPLRTDGGDLDRLVSLPPSGTSPGGGLAPEATAELPVHAALAAWALDRHNGHPPAGLIERWREALLLSNREEADFAATLALREAAKGWASLSGAQRKRWAARADAWWAELLLRIDAPATAAAIAAWRKVTPVESIAPEPVLSGDHLIAAGFAPGPSFRGWLEAAYDEQLEGRVRSLPDALAFVRSMAGRG